MVTAELTPFEQGALAVACELVPADAPLRALKLANAVTTAVVHHSVIEQVYSAPQSGAFGEIK